MAVFRTTQAHAESAYLKLNFWLCWRLRWCRVARFVDDFLGVLAVIIFRSTCSQRGLIPCVSLNFLSKIESPRSCPDPAAPGSQPKPVPNGPHRPDNFPCIFSGSEPCAGRGVFEGFLFFSRGIFRIQIHISARSCANSMRVYFLML